MIRFTRDRVRALLRSAGATARLGRTSSGPLTAGPNVVRPVVDTFRGAAAGCVLFLDAPDVIDLERLTGRRAESHPSPHHDAHHRPAVAAAG